MWDFTVQDIVNLFIWIRKSGDGIVRRQKISETLNFVCEVDMHDRINIVTARVAVVISAAASLCDSDCAVS